MILSKMNVKSLTNLMVTSYRNENPQHILLQVLIDFETMRPHSSFTIEANDVVEFVANVKPPPAKDTSLFQDFMSLLCNQGVIDEPIAYIVQFVYFATQQCHLFGKITPVDNGADHEFDLQLHKRQPIICYASYNVPCSYVWLDVTRKAKHPKIVKHTMPNAEYVRPMRIALTRQGTLERFAYDFETCCCSPTVRKGVIHLHMTDSALTCNVAGMDGLPDGRGVPYVLVLSFEKRFCQAVMQHANGKQSEQVVIAHYA